MFHLLHVSHAVIAETVAVVRVEIADRVAVTVAQAAAVSVADAPETEASNL